MIRRPSGSTLNNTLVPYATLFRSVFVAGLPIDNQPLALTPNITVKGAARYYFETSGLGTISPWVQFSYRTATHNSVARTLLNRIDGYMLIDAGLTWMAPGQKVRVDFLVQNETDKIYDLNPNPTLALSSTRQGEQRSYSVRSHGRWYRPPRHT